MRTWFDILTRPSTKERKTNARRIRRNWRFDALGVEPLEHRVLLAADLQVTETQNIAGSVTQGQLLDYHISVTNIGDATATGSVLTDTLPGAGATFIASASDTGTVSVSSGNVNINLGNIAAGQTATIDVWVMPNNQAAVNSSLTNTASVSSPDDTNTADNTASVSNSVAAATSSAADLALGASLPSGSISVGQQVPITLTITNNSANAATNVQLVDSIPAGTTYVSASGSGATVTEQNGVAVINLGTLAAGQSATVTLNVSPVAAGVFTDTAVATTASGDVNAANNIATVSGTVGAVTTPPGAGCYLAGQAGDGTNTTFVGNLYRELLGRDADANGEAYWANYLTVNGAGANAAVNAQLRQNVIVSFMTSEEYREHVVTCLYETLLGRVPDAGGLQFFANQLANMGLGSGHFDESIVVSELVGSDEYFARSGNSAQAFVDAMYRDLLGRQPDAGGERFWTNVVTGIDTGGIRAISRGDVAFAILHTSEAEHKLLNGAYPNSAGPSPAAGTPTGGSYALAQFTGDGGENLYFQGNFPGNANQGSDVYFDALLGGTPWDDTIALMLDSPHYFNAALD